MACDQEELRHVPLFALLDDEEMAVLAGQVELKTFAARQRIYKMGDRGRARVYGDVGKRAHYDGGPGPSGSGGGRAGAWGILRVRVDAGADAAPDQRRRGDEATCLEVDRNDIAMLLQRKPLAGMDMLSVLGRQFHASQQLVRMRANRNANEVIEEDATFGERIADTVAQFGGSWTFIITFVVVLVVYSGMNILLGKKAWDPYPFILLNLFLSMLAAIQAPVIMMSQNRQDTKDRVRGELDLRREPAGGVGDSGVGAETEFAERQDGGRGGFDSRADWS